MFNFVALDKTADAPAYFFRFRFKMAPAITTSVVTCSHSNQPIIFLSRNHSSVKPTSQIRPKMKIKYLLIRLSLVLWMSTLAFAAKARIDITVDGVKYVLNNETKPKTASVVGHISGITVANIYPTINYNGQEYPVTTIVTNAFNKCSFLTSVTIPNSVTSIGKQAFYGCSALTEVTIPNSVTTIGYSAFYDCKHLNCLTIGNSVTSIDHQAFYGCSALKEITIPNSVTSIGDFAFNGCSSLNRLTIGNSVTSIGEFAFYGCSQLTEVTIPNSVTSINSYAFHACSGLGTLYFNAENCTKCGGRDMYDKFYPAFPSNLKTLVIGEKVKTIPECAFYDCSYLTSVTIPNSVTSIGKFAFYGCSGLETLYFNAENCAKCGLEYNPAFPSNLKTLVLGENVNNIPDYAFKKCSGLNSVTIPNSVTTIGEEAFYGCSSMAEVTIPNSVTTIGINAFQNCSYLNSVRINNMNDWARTKFMNGYSNPLCYANNLYMGDASEPVKNIVIEDKRPVSSFAFFGATCLEKAMIKDGATVGKSTFYYCLNLTDIYLNATELNEYTVFDCTSLKNIYVPQETPPTAPYNAFSNYEAVNLYVPQGSVSKYENTVYCWCHFLNVYESDFKDLDTLFAPDYVNVDSGIEDVENDYDTPLTTGRQTDIYNLQGVCLKRNATEEDIRALVPGLYIIAGEKVFVR